MNEITVQLTAWLLGLIAALEWQRLTRERVITFPASANLAFALDDMATQAAALARWE